MNDMEHDAIETFDDDSESLGLEGLEFIQADEMDDAFLDEEVEDYDFDMDEDAMDRV